MGLCTEIFSKLSATYGGGGETYKRKLEIATAPNLREIHNIFFRQNMHLEDNYFLEIFWNCFESWVKLKNQKNRVSYVYFWNHGFYTKIDNEHFCSLQNFTLESVIKIFDLSQICHTVGMGIWGLREQNANKEFYAKTSTKFGSSMSKFIKKYSTSTFQSF